MKTQRAKAAPRRVFLTFPLHGNYPTEAFCTRRGAQAVIDHTDRYSIPHHVVEYVRAPKRKRGGK